MKTNITFLTVAFMILFFANCSDDPKNSGKEDIEFMSIQNQKKRILEEFRSIDQSAKDQGNMMLSSEANSSRAYQPFRNPAERKSFNGLLDTKLEVAYTTQKIWNINKKSSISVNLRNYESSLVGPTMRIKQSDLLRVKVINNLPSTGMHDSPCDPMNTMHHSSVDPCDQVNNKVFNTTNLHTHGLHVSPSDSSDNVLVHIMPSCEFQNHIQIPGNHPQGTFWYHGHVHGSTAIQVSSGMAGALIVEGGMDTLQQIKDAEEKIFILQQIPYTEDENGFYGVEDFKNSFGPGSWERGVRQNGWRTMVNGQTYPIIRMKSGEVQRWRFIHAGVRETIDIHLEEHNLNEIAMDGIALGTMNRKNSIELQPGYRSDVLIKANEVAEADTLFLIDLESDAISGLQAELESPKIIAIVIISSEKKDMNLPNEGALAMYKPFEPIKDSEVEGNELQTVHFNIDVSQIPICFTIDGKPFDMSSPPRKLKLGEANTWTLTSGLANHPYHIHVNSFEVHSIEHRNGRITEFDPPIWKDTYMVKVGEKVTIRSRYEDFTGDFVLHCHILDHEDQGMMQLVRIVEEPSS
ncbi:multicopper oxidase family protein [Reichenbachiella sp.]|uniref:multicopper oxidase family protein n=1 Tax=Reichenbachiella sp. TaxID=2184521 RepID=UPI003BB19716